MRKTINIPADIARQLLCHLGLEEFANLVEDGMVVSVGVEACTDPIEMSVVRSDDEEE